MTGPANLDWLYLLGGWLLGASAVLLLLWSLFRDRGRKLRRCPKCWYDMSGTPGLQCPECGRTATTERRLHRTHRRWRYAALAIVLGLVAYIVGSVPRYQSGGWVALLPSSILLCMAPVQDPPLSAGSPLSMLRGRFAFGTTPATPTLPWRQQLGDEVWKRLTKGDMARWQSQNYLRRYFQKVQLDPWSGIELPKRWPTGCPIPVRFKQQSVSEFGLEVRSPGAAWPSGDPTLSPQAAPVGEVRVELGLQGASGHVYRATRTLPITIQNTRDTFLTRVDSNIWNPEIAAGMAPHLSTSNGKPVVILHHQSNGAPWETVRFIVAYVLEVRVRDRLIGTGRGRLPFRENLWIWWQEAQITWVADADELLLKGPAILTVRGDPADAADAFMSQPFDVAQPACWTGEFSTTLTMRQHPRERP